MSLVGQDLWRRNVINEHIGHIGKMSVSGYSDQRFKPGCISMLSPCERYLIRIASVDSAQKWVPGEDTLVKGVQCY